MSVRIKKDTRILFFLVTGFWLLVSNCYAAPCYGTRMPQKNKISTGLQVHNICKRYLEHESGKIRSLQEFWLLSYGIFDWLSLDLKGGSGYIKEHPKGSAEIDYPTYLGGGYGLRIELLESKNLKTVFGFQHISIHPKQVFINDKKNKAVLDDWQFSLLGSYKFKKTTPYLGTRWSRIGYIHWIDKQRELVKSDLTKSIGLIVGGDFALNKKCWLNLEGSFFDSDTVALSINYGF